jgi:adenylate cyclase
VTEPPPVQRRLAAILAADVVGYSRLMGDDETGTLARLKDLRETLVAPRIAANHGRIVKLMGDGVLAEFASVVDAVQCAVEIQAGMADRNAGEAEGRRMVFRIGINLGDVIVDGDDIYGDGVNIAARLEGSADPGGIVISGTTYDQARNKLEAAFEPLGNLRLKNIAEPVRAYRVKPTTIPGRRARRRQGPWKEAVAAVAAMAVLAVAGLYLSDMWDAAPPPDTPSIAVLRFANLGAGDQEDYFAEGMTDDLITDLSQIAGLLVIARNSAFAFDAEAADVREVSDELGVRYVLQGSVQRAGDRVRINAQLIDGASGEHVWAERYDREITDIFALQDEVIAAIVAALSVELTAAEQTRIDRLPTASLEAYDHYLRAEQKVYTQDTATLREVITHYQRAIELDPGFAEAHAGLARVLVDVLGYDYMDVNLSGLARDQAYEAAGRALALNPNLPRGFAVLGILQMLDGEHDEAVASLKKAVALDPSGADSHLDLAVVLTFAGRHAEGLAAMETVLRLNPRPQPQVYDYYGFVLLMNRRFEAAVAALQQGNPATPSDLRLELLASANAALGDLDAARASIAELLGRDSSFSLAAFRVIYAHHRRPEDLALRIDGLRAAGLPEWSGGFVGRPEDRLDATTLGSLALGHVWIGRRMSDGAPFVMQIEASGDFAVRAGTGLISGTASLDGDLFCTRSPAVLLGRRQCSPVYRNPGGTADTQDEYVYPNTYGVWLVSVSP